MYADMKVLCNDDAGCTGRPDGLLPTVGSGQTVFPHRWYFAKEKKSRQKVFDFVTSDILVPSPTHLFEDST